MFLPQHNTVVSLPPIGNHREFRRIFSDFYPLWWRHYKCEIFSKRIYTGTGTSNTYNVTGTFVLERTLIVSYPAHTYTRSTRVRNNNYNGILFTILWFYCNTPTAPITTAAVDDDIIVIHSSAITIVIYYCWFNIHYRFYSLRTNRPGDKSTNYERIALVIDAIRIL